MTKDEVKEFMKGVFSIRQENIDGRKIITIIPTGSDERAKQQAKIDAFKSSLINKPINEFNLTDLNNKKWSSKELKGKVLVINFWFTACKPCIQEMPHLNKLVEENKNNEVVFLAPAPENENQIKRFLKKYSFDYNITPASTDLIAGMSIENFPTHLIIDKEGIIRQVFIGYADDIKEKLQAEIDKLINKMNKPPEIQLQKETLRIETFSDGVFCIAVTLLSIEIGVELHGDVTNKELTHALLAKWPIYLAYVISFVNVLLAWIGHHSLFKMFSRADNGIMITNGLLLMLIALVPFPTKTLGEFLLTEGLKTATIFYTGYFVLISLGFRLLWFAASRKKENLTHDVTAIQIRLLQEMKMLVLFVTRSYLLSHFLTPG